MLPGSTGTRKTGGWTGSGRPPGRSSWTMRMCVEDLDMDSIRQRWGRKASDYAYTEFLELLAYQVEQTGDPGSMSPDY